MAVDPSTGDAAVVAEPSPTVRPRGRRLGRFVGHYLEMVVAMIVGMVALDPLWPAEWLAREGVHAVLMATDMTVGMGAWMALRRHRWLRILEMSAVMYLPFVALLVPYGFGVLPASALVIAGHVIMFPLMLLAMLWRRHEYGL